MRYKITYYTVNGSWISWSEEQVVEYAKTKDELDLLISLIKEDTTIVRGFWEDVASKAVTHIKN